MAASPSESKDKELERLQELIVLVEKIESIVVDLQDEEEYKRMREYLNSRFEVVDFPYSSPFIKEVQGLV